MGIGVPCRMRTLLLCSLAAICLCCSGGTQPQAHASGDQRPRQAKLVFTVVQSADKGAHDQAAAGATLLVPLFRGAEPSYWAKVASYDTRAGAEAGAGAGAVAAWNDHGLPALRVAAHAHLRDDGVVQLGYAVESLEDAGTAPPPPGSPAGTPAQRLTTGPILDGDVLLPSKGGTLTLGEIHDAKGRKLEVKLSAEIAAVE
jgi:hypothetical protein